LKRLFNSKFAHRAGAFSQSAEYRRGGRAMSNFGALHLRVVTPYEKAFREAVSAVGAAPLLARPKNSTQLQRPRAIAAW